MFVLNQNASDTDLQAFLNSAPVKNLAVNLSYRTDNQGGYMDLYNGDERPIAHLGDDGASNGHLQLNDATGAPGATLSTDTASGGSLTLQNTSGATSVKLETTTSGDGSLSVNTSSGAPSVTGTVGSAGGAVNVYNELAASIAQLQATVNGGGSLSLSNGASNTVNILGNDNSGNASLTLSNAVAQPVVTGRTDLSTGGGLLQTANINGTTTNVVNNDTVGNGQISILDTAGSNQARLGVRTPSSATPGDGGYLDIRNGADVLALRLSAAPSGNGDLTLYNNGGTGLIAELGNSGSNTGQLKLTDGGGLTGVQLDTAANGYGSGRMMISNDLGTQVLNLQGDGNQNGQVTVFDKSGGQRAFAGVDGNDNGQVVVTNSANANVTRDGAAATSWTAVPGQIIAALSGIFQATGSVGVGPDTTSAPNAYLYESGGVGYAYVQGGIDSHCFDDQGGSMVMQNGCSLQTEGNSISTQNGTNYGSLTAGNTDVHGSLTVTGGVDDTCFDDRMGTFTMKCGTNFENGLTVSSGVTQLEGGLTVTGGVTDVSQKGIRSLCFDDTTGMMEVTCAAKLKSLEVTNAAQFDDGMTVNGGPVYANGGIVSLCINDTTGTLDVTCAAKMKSLEVTNTVQFDDGLTVNGGPVYANGGISDPCFDDTSGTFTFKCSVTMPTGSKLTVYNLEVTNTAVFGGGIQSKCFNDADGTAKVNCALQVNGDLTVTGKAEVGSLEVTGGDLTVDKGDLVLSDGNIDVNGYIQDKCFNDTTDALHVNCPGYMDGGLTVSGGGLTVSTGVPTNLNGGLTVNNAVATLNDGLTVNNGIANLTDGLSVTNALTQLQDGLTVTNGTTSLQSGLTVSGGVTNVTNSGIKSICFNDNGTFDTLSVSCDYLTGKNETLSGRIGVAGYGTTGDNVSFPSGWGGGVATFDLYAHGSVGVGSGAVAEADLTTDGQGDGQLSLGRTTTGSDNTNLVTVGAVNYSGASSGWGGVMKLFNMFGKETVEVGPDANANGEVRACP